MREKTKKILSIILCITMICQIMPIMNTHAAEEDFSYAIFASTNEEGGVLIDATNGCINGNIATNGTVDYSGNININGKIKDNIDEKSYIPQQTMLSEFFSDNVTIIEDDYTINEINVNVNNSILGNGSISLCGNVNLNGNVYSKNNLLIEGQVLNANNTVLFSEQGNIEIHNENVGITGLIYAPYGSVIIEGKNVNLNSVVIIANSVSIKGENVNINYSQSIGKLVYELLENEEDLILDSDSDGLIDYSENKLGTDIDNKDTDNDGLSDYEEVFIIETDPLKYDSIEEGISDSDVDKDNDGLSSTDEITYGTKAYKYDSDEDGISDGEEIFKYNTNPLIYDTDEDGLSDGEELALGVDANLADTDNDGIIDGQEYYLQKVEQNKFSETLFEDNIAVPQDIEISAKGYIKETIKVKEYTGHLLGDKQIYIGKPIEISGADINDGNLSFVLSEEYLINDYVFEGNHTNGLLICCNDGYETVPLETVYYEETRTLSAKIYASGTYFVIDVVSWIDSMGIELEVEETSEVSLMTFSNTSIADVEIKGQVDIVFIIDTTGSMTPVIKNVRNNITEFVEEIENANINASMALVDYRDITYDNKNYTHVKTNGNSIWFTDVDSFKTELSKLWINGGGDTPETAIDAVEFARRLEMRDNAQKFFVLVTDAGYKINNNYGLTSMQEAVDLLVADKINVSVVSGSSYKDDYEALYENTGGVFADINGNFKEELLSIAEKVAEETNNGYWISINGLIPQCIKLEEKPNSLNPVDTDGDGLYDTEELMSEEPIYFKDVTTFISGLLPSVSFKTTSIPVYWYYSNPVEVDSDFDAVDDCEETIIGTDPLKEDTDGDELSDGKELAIWFDPLDDNYDGDTFDDYEEYYNDTNPFEYDLTEDEWIEEFRDGVIKGDYIEDPSIPALIGQISSSSFPVIGGICDLRDTIANASHNNWFMAGLSALGLIPTIGDASKATSKVAEFIAKNADKTDELLDLCITVSKKVPDGLVDIIPASVIDDIVEGVSKGDVKLTRELYSELIELAAKFGKKIPTALDDFKDATKVVSDTKVWNKKPLERGKLIDKILGNNLGETYKTYDVYDKSTQVATSIKSLDPMCKSYQSKSKLKARLENYAKQLRNGADEVFFEKGNYDIDVKQLNLVLPDVSITEMQKDVIDEFIKNNKDIEIIITVLVD